MVFVGLVEGDESADRLWTRIILSMEGTPEQGPGIPDFARRRASSREVDRLEHEEVGKARLFLLDATPWASPNRPVRGSRGAGDGGVSSRRRPPRARERSIRTGLGA